MGMTLQGTAGQAATTVPRTEAELRAVMLQRDELRSQLQTNSSSLERLTIERSLASQNNDQQAVREIAARMTEVRTRSARIEDQLVRLDEQVVQAIANGVGTRDVPAAMPPQPVGVVPAPGLPSPDYITEAVSEAVRDVRNDYERKMVGGGVTLILLGALAWRWAWRRAAARLRRELAAVQPTGQRELRDAVDAIALEVERISENQRFVTKLLSEKPLAEPVQRAADKPR